MFYDNTSFEQIKVRLYLALAIEISMENHYQHCHLSCIYFIVNQSYVIDFEGQFKTMILLSMLAMDLKYFGKANKYILK
jgi:hypothetical protein